MKLLEYISLAEIVVIRLGALVLLVVFVAKLIDMELRR